MLSKTSATRIIDTIEFFHQAFEMPKTSSADAAIFAANDLIHALQNPSPATPFAQLGSDQLNALQQLADILDTTINHPTKPGLHHDTSPRVPNKPSPRVDATPSQVTYGRIVVSIRPQKTEVERTRLTIGGNLIDYPREVSTRTPGLTTAKIL
jgi:hypothetical protein